MRLYNGGPIKLKFKKYREECSLLLAIAIVLDPWFKMDVIHCYYNNHIYGVDSYMSKEFTKPLFFYGKTTSMISLILSTHIMPSEKMVVPPVLIWLILVLFKLMDQVDLTGLRGGIKILF